MDRRAFMTAIGGAAAGAAGFGGQRRAKVCADVDRAVGVMVGPVPRTSGDSYWVDATPVLTRFFKDQPMRWRDGRTNRPRVTFKIKGIS